MNTTTSSPQQSHRAADLLRLLQTAFPKDWKTISATFSATLALPIRATLRPRSWLDLLIACFGMSNRWESKIPPPGLSLIGHERTPVWLRWFR
jgi:hypothetical protein